jgi:cellulose synthase/poly-beta-1,6-N-acetylglucosamine synthase-like glycosyltransferase
VIAAAYLVVFALAAIFALHRLWLLVGYWTAPSAAPPVHPERATGEAGASRRAAPAPASVTIQIPLYNERTVCERVVDAACALTWGDLEVQILDDSDDETVTLVAARVAHHRARGVNVLHIRRPVREGFKAGALAYGHARARGELIAVFDADFVPPPDFLQRMVPSFADARVGMVQARWGHLNAEDGLLTRAQAALLDAHFLVENGARSAAGRFFNFSGTAGMWRRAAIDEAGGWQSDTLTEDMDLSYRAQLAGWRFVFRPDVVVPAELPADLAALRTQQFRWAKGQTQVLRKLLGAVLRARLPLLTKVDAVLHLASNLVYPLLLLLSLLWAPALASGLPVAPVWALAPTVVVGLFYAAVGPARLVGVAGAIVLCLGLVLGQSRAVIEGLLGRRSPFVRTPKRGTGKAYATARQAAWPELALAVVYVAIAGGAASQALYSTPPFAALFALGAGWVGIAERRPNRK